jgi:hypothetical protein
MKLSSKILLLLAAAIVIETSVITLAHFNAIHEKLIEPIVGFIAINITLAGLAVSSLQWEKSRLGNEVLKEQFNLISGLLEHLNTCPNSGFPVTSHDDRVLMGAQVTFSALDYRALDNFPEQERFIVINFPPDGFPSQLFSELDNSVICNPFFPTDLFTILNKLDTNNYFLQCDYAKNWFNDELISPERQFVLSRGAKKECLDKKPFRIQSTNGHLRIADVLTIYKEFSLCLDEWLKKNHLDVRVKKA